MIIRANVNLCKPSANGKTSKTLADGNVTFRDEQLGDFTIYKVRVVDGPDGPFVAFPQEAYTDKKTNEKKYAKLISCSRDWQDRVSEQVLLSYSELMRSKPQTSTVGA